MCTVERITSMQEYLKDFPKQLVALGEKESPDGQWEVPEPLQELLDSLGEQAGQLGGLLEVASSATRALEEVSQNISFMAMEMLFHRRELHAECIEPHGLDSNLREKLRISPEENGYMFS